MPRLPVTETMTDVGFGPTERLEYSMTSSSSMCSGDGRGEAEEGGKGKGRGGEEKGREVGGRG